MNYLFFIFYFLTYDPCPCFEDNPMCKELNCIENFEYDIDQQPRLDTFNDISWSVGSDSIQGVQWIKKDKK